MIRLLFTLIIFHICFFPKMLSAQETPSADSVKTKIIWVRGAAGIGGAGLAASGDLYFATVSKNRYYSLHGFTSSGFLQNTEVHTVAATIGWFQMSKHGFIGFSAGMGPVWGIKEGEFIGMGFLWPRYEEDPYFTVGIPLQMEFRLDAGNFAGAGLIFYGNLNLKNPYYGAMISLNMGKLR